MGTVEHWVGLGERAVKMAETVEGDRQEKVELCHHLSVPGAPGPFLTEKLT